jgi:signal transduction histidine kinase
LGEVSVIRETFFGIFPWVRSLSLRLAFAEFDMKMNNLVKGLRVNFRTYHGVAGVLRRKTVLSVTTALVYGSLAIMLGFLLREYQVLDISEVYVVMGLMFVLGLMINAWLTLRLMRKPLDAVERVEDGLVEMVRSKNFRLNNSRDPLDFQATPFLQAYYSMLQHIDSLETSHLEFLNKVMHNIRSPMATIMGYSELLAESDLRKKDEFIDKASEIIHRQGTQVCELLENATLAAEVDAERFPSQFTEFELDTLVEAVAHDKKYDPIIDFTNQTGRVIVKGDPWSLQIAIRNLVDNGIKFSQLDQPVHLRLAYGQTLGWIEIQVKDHGFGIEDKDQAIVFRRFTRVRNEHTQFIPGNGLGLYIAQRIVEKHAGTIRIDSTLDEGSTFTICLPLATES